MPIYTYRCESCGVRFERQQGYNDPVLTRCPECNKKAIRKVYTPVGIAPPPETTAHPNHRTVKKRPNRQNRQAITLTSS
jgi:putative FmdB family regulatory protein